MTGANQRCAPETPPQPTEVPGEALNVTVAAPATPTVSPDISRPSRSRRWRRILWWFGLTTNGLALAGSALGLTFSPFLLGSTVVQYQTVYNAVFTLGGLSWIACAVIWLARPQTAACTWERTASGVAGTVAVPILIGCLIFGAGNLLSEDSYQVLPAGPDGCRLIIKTTDTVMRSVTSNYQACKGSPVLRSLDNG